MIYNIEQLKIFRRIKIIFKFPLPAADKIYNERIMVINPFHTQKIIAAYNQQLTMKTRFSAGKIKDLVPKDLVTISEESKRRLAAAGNPQTTVKSLTNNQGLQKGGV